MKKSALFGIITCLSLAVGAGVTLVSRNKPQQANATVSAGTYTYDFTTKFTTYASEWGTSYSKRTISSTAPGTSLPSATITLGSANKQSSTIEDRPVSKASENTFQLTEAGFHITSFQLQVAQWTTKLPSFDIGTVTVKDKQNDLLSASALGLTSTHSDTGGDSGTLAIESSSITKVWFNNTNTNQTGYSKLIVTIAANKTFGTLNHIKANVTGAKTTYQVGDTFSPNGVDVLGYDGADESAAAASAIPTASLAFTNTSSVSLIDYVFSADDISSEYQVTVSGTIGSVTKTTTYNIVVEASSVFKLTLSDSVYFSSGSSIGATPYSYALANAGNRFLLEVTGTSSTTTKVLAGTKTGQQIGTSDSQAKSIIFKSGIFGGPSNETSITKVILGVRGASSSTTATIACSVGGASAGTASIDNDNTDKLFTFKPGSPKTGSIAFTFSGIAKGVFIVSLEVFATTGTTDADKAAVFAHDVELANSCNASLEYSALKTKYDLLSANVQSLADAMTIDDISEVGTSKITRNLCTVAQKLAAMKNRAEAGSGLSFNDGKEDSSLALTIALIGTFIILATGTGIVLFKKKRA